MTDVLLGLDVGTGSLKAALVDRAGRILAHADAGYVVASPRPGWAETGPLEWWAAAVTATRRVVEESGAAARVAAIGVSGQMHGFALTADDGSPVRPAILWADDRAVAQVERFRALPDEMRARLGNPLLPGMAGPILCWLAEHEPEGIARARWILFPKDWLRMRLTGAAATDPSDASAGLLWDVPADGWAMDLVEHLGLPAHLLPPAQASTSLAGPLVPVAARALRLPAGIPVVTGSTDTAASAVGTGAVRAGDVRLTVGTGAQAFVLHDGPRVDPLLRTHCYRSAAPGQWYAMAAVQNAGLALDWLRRALGAEWDELFALAADPPRTGGPLFVPFLTTERPHQPRGDSGGRFLDVRLDATRRDLLRAGLEGVACGIRAALDALVPPDDPAPIPIAGGSTRQPTWTRLLADVLGRRLVVVETPAQSARGAALEAAVGIGAWPSLEATAAVAPRAGEMVEPDPERAGACAGLYGRYVEAWTAER